MKTQSVALWATIATLGTSFIAPLSASAQTNRQKTKNNWRNAAVGSAAVAGYGLIKHKNAATLLGIAGAAYSANRYEQDRKHQSQHSSEMKKREARRDVARSGYSRHGGNYTRDGKKYYKFDGKMYVMDLNSGARHRVS